MGTKLQSNLWKIQLSCFLRNFLVYAPIIMVSFQDKGLTFTQIGLLMALANISLLFEIPAGMLSDRWSRRHVLALAGILGAISMFFWTTETFLFLALGTIFRSLMIACISGTDTALLYDSLKELKREKEYLKYNSWKFGAGTLGFAAAAILASLLSSSDFYQTHFFITALAMLASGVVGLSMTEPHFHKSIEKPISHLRESFKVALKHTEVYKLVRYGLCITPTIIIVFQYMQFFLKDAGIDPMRFGLIYASYSLIGFAASRITHKFEGKIGKRWTIIFLPSMLALGIVTLIFGTGPFIVYLGMAFVEVIFGMEGSIINSYIQEHLESKYRSTVESISSLLGGMYNTIMLLLMGMISSSFNIRVAFTFMLVVWLFLVIPPTYFLIKDAYSTNSFSIKSR